jgi:hypothetical protein
MEPHAVEEKEKIIKPSGQSRNKMSTKNNVYTSLKE